MNRHSFFYCKKVPTIQCIFLIFLLIFLFSQAVISSELYLTETKKEIIKKIQANIYLDNFKTAHTYSDSLILFYNDDPIGYLFKAAVYLGEMTDAENNLYPIQFKQMIDTSIILGEKNILSADSNRTAWNYLCIGHARAYRSLYESRFGSMGSALKNGFKAKSAYQHGLQYDSSLYDLYGGLGMYHYWKSAKAGFLRWIGVFKDDKQKGIDELYLTIDSSEISADAANSSLIYIYIDTKQYDSATVIAEKMQNKYPSGKIFLWALAKIYFEIKQYDKAIKNYQQILDRVYLEKNFYNTIECEYQIYKAYKNSKNETMAKTIAQRFMLYVNKIPMEIRKRQRDKIKILLKVATD